ncbi:arylesterase [Flagellimonas halotolerans]|uniref:Arylesterase n=1 Tax=Flagellimonas halotolerans TaxID=3112164 RepID=A0ABU6ITA0_9FLAO|nr:MULTISPECIES: arylesterase [unclassified Allomuricauda]MEC3966419.1 arylesterase [Muricauda sp. SYSU M86414]MEC4266284.1 arylesterase [Muricauda sp. SYSU M84420]
MTKKTPSFPLPLMFCYFLSLLLLGCGEKNAKRDAEKTSPPQETTVTETPDSNKKILFFGDSLTAGYGLEVSQAFPALIQQKIDSLGLDYTVINAGLSGETTASGKNRLEWVLQDDIDIIIIELGANDGLRGVPLRETESNLQSMVDTVQSKLPNAKIILAGMKIPPNMGPDYTSKFESLFPELASSENITLIPFLLENVAGIPELNQGDGIHPTVEGQKLVAENVWEVLGPML